MRHLEHLAAFLCLYIALVSPASPRENLERAAELAVEKAAERAAERAVEKALESGNTTTESKLVRQSYSNSRKNPNEKSSNHDVSLNPEETKDHRHKKDSTYLTEFHRDDWSNERNDKWRRFPRSWRQSTDDHQDKITLREDRDPLPLTILKKIPYQTYPVPYEITAPTAAAVSHYAVEQGIPYPVKVYVPVELAESYSMEKIPHHAKIDRMPYKIEVTTEQSYILEKNVAAEAKPASQQFHQHPVNRGIKYNVKTAGKTPSNIPANLPAKIPAKIPPKIFTKISETSGEKAPSKVEKRLNAPRHGGTLNRPHSMETIKSYRINHDKAYSTFRERQKVENGGYVKKSLPKVTHPRYSSQAETPVTKSYENAAKRQVPVVEKIFPYFVEVPVPVKVNWAEGRDVNLGENEGSPRESEESNWRRSRWIGW